MRNPNRTTKRERAAARRRLAAACRQWGTAYTARASRTLTDAVIRLALALDVPPHFLAGADPGANHWNATVEPGPFRLESWRDARRIRVTGFGGTATFTEDELSVVFDPTPLAAPPFGYERFATGGYVKTEPGADLIAPVGAPPFDPWLYGRYRRDAFEPDEDARPDDEG